ncbi:MAG: hypothetical protein KBC21_02950 [Candidatus Pacebacteria bacterium]|nr:hypothetical protein [Candidatus Paceibacterota bacterium]
MVFVYVFVASFILNLVWENTHAALYTHHLVEKITEKTLVIASIGDAAIITLFAVLLFFVPFLKGRVWLVVPIGIFVAIMIERYALSVNR